MKKALLYVMVIVATIMCIVIIAIMQPFGELYQVKGEQPPDVKSEQYSLLVCVLNNDGSVKQMDLEEYVTRVVLGEVSASYHPEALKAQAVAARTYTLYCILVSRKHSAGLVCTDYRCCQAYCEPDDYLKNDGTSQGLEKILGAVEATKGEALYYNNKLICATYFACSGGKTEDAEAVWGEEYPYLKSVVNEIENDCCDVQQIKITKQELEQYLDAKFSDSSMHLFGFKIDTPGDGVALMRIGGRLYTGVELRKLLGLKSTVIDMKIENEIIAIQTKGYGHRVGMSQHGANLMAESGKTYEGILMHYYTDVTLRTCIPQQ